MLKYSAHCQYFTNVSRRLHLVKWSRAPPGCPVGGTTQTANVTTLCARDRDRLWAGVGVELRTWYVNSVIFNGNVMLARRVAANIAVASSACKVSVSSQLFDHLFREKHTFLRQSCRGCLYKFAASCLALTKPLRLTVCHVTEQHHVHRLKTPDNNKHVLLDRNDNKRTNWLSWPSRTKQPRAQLYQSPVILFQLYKNLSVTLKSWPVTESHNNSKKKITHLTTAKKTLIYTEYIYIYILSWSKMTSNICFKPSKIPCR